MRNYCILISILLLTCTAQSQIVPTGTSGFEGRQRDSLVDDRMINVKLSGKTKYTDYKIISHKNDTTFIDTTLSIQKDYLFNYLRQDNFELLPFQNQGQTFNQLGYNYSEVSLLPEYGSQGQASQLL